LLRCKHFVFFQQKKAVKVEDDAVSDDEIPSDVNLQDPYFAEGLSKCRNQMNGIIYFSSFSVFV